MEEQMINCHFCGRSLDAPIVLDETYTCTQCGALYTSTLQEDAEEACLELTDDLWGTFVLDLTEAESLCELSIQIAFVLLEVNADMTRLAQGEDGEDIEFRTVWARRKTGNR